MFQLSSIQSEMMVYNESRCTIDKGYQRDRPCILGLVIGNACFADIRTLQIVDIFVHESVVMLPRRSLGDRLDRVQAPIDKVTRVRFSRKRNGFCPLLVASSYTHRPIEMLDTFPDEINSLIR